MTYSSYPVSGGGGSGDVQGPVLSVNNGVVLFDGTSGKTIKDLGVGSANQVLVTDGTTPSFALIADANVSGSAAIAYSKLATLTASRALQSSAGGIIEVSSVTSTELGYVSGVTSSIQTQLNAKEPTISLTANRAVVSSAGGALTVSATTDTEIGYVSGVTSAIQTQIDSKTGIADNETITGNWTFNNIITGSITGNAGTVTNGAYINVTNSFTSTQNILATTNQLVLGTTNTTTISATAPASSAVYTIPDVGTTADFVMTAGAQTIGGAKTFSDSISSDAAHMGGYGLVPVGAIVAYNPGYYTSTSNGGFTRVGPGSNDAAGVNAFLNAKGWYVCDGAAVNNANSPIWNAAGRNLPNLSDQRFLMGSSSAGGAGGSNANRDISHTHSVTSNVTAAAITLTTANLPVHSHAKGTLASAVSLTGTTTFASASHAHKSGIVRRPDNLWEFESYSTVIVSDTTVTGALISVEGGARMLKGDSTRGLGPVNAYRTDGPSATASVGISNGAITGSTANAGSGTSFTPSLTNNAVNSGGMSANSSISILPQYLTTFYIVRVF